MRKITVFDDGSNYTMRWLRSLIWAKDEFEKYGIKISFYSGATMIPRKVRRNRNFTYDDLMDAFRSNSKFDIVFFAFHPGRGLFEYSDSKIINLLKIFKDKSNLLVWLDTADSTGTTKFQFIPYVDKYLKKQIFKEKKLYFSPIWGGRLHCEYYHNLLGLDDPEVNIGDDFFPLPKEDMEKLGVSWNVGCGNLFGGNIIKQILHPYSYSKLNFIAPEKDKEFDIHFRGSTWSPIAGYQRRKTIEILGEITGMRIPDAAQKIPHSKYVKELKNSKMICSPFGWGEICTRDFEAFLYGATLIKPCMDHLVTYPNWYLPNITYVPISWNFSNFKEIINNAKTIEGKKQFLSIAQNGQNMYRDTMCTDKGKNNFVQHLLYEIGVLK